jgi:hypothetical protein
MLPVPEEVIGCCTTVCICNIGVGRGMQLRILTVSCQRKKTRLVNVPVESSVHVWRRFGGRVDYMKLL